MSKISYLDTYRRAELGEATLDPEFITKCVPITTPKEHAVVEARASAQSLEDDRVETAKELCKLEYENDLMREALKDLAYGAVMMIAVTSGAQRDYVREVYRVATQAVGGSGV